MYPQVFGKYVLERELARGGMARLLLATLRGAGGFEKKLVVKQIRDELACDEEFVRRFVQEAKTTVALVHPNIVPVYELGVELGTYFLAMELVEGASLAEIVRAHGRLTPDEGAYVGVEVCRALDYAHRRMSVVHGDVTPRNVMVDEEGQVKVIDFGISAPVATAPTGHGVFGSPGHMPPEQMAGKQLAPSADVFAAAVLLVELWSGQAPFRRPTMAEVERALREPHPKPSAIDIRLLPLDEVFASAMALEPSARPQNAEDLARVLRRFLSGIDLHDVARKLGDRVREVRISPPAADEGRPVLQRPPSRPTGVAIATKTFAAREELTEWREPRTRELHSSRPTAKLPDGDTVATRPIVTSPPKPVPERRPADAERRVPVRPAPPSRRAMGLGVAAALFVAGAYFAGRGAGRNPVSVTFASAVSASASAAAEAPGRAVQQPLDPRTAASASESTSPGPSTVSPANPGPPTAKATLSLVGDGTIVTVDGASYGSAPLHLALEPGAHTVLFTFPATGESKGSRLSIGAGERLTLRADFTGATPVIRVAR